jgi:hypothetical protein
MRQLGSEEKNRALNMLGDVFSSVDPCDQPVRHGLPRNLLFPVSYLLDEREYRAVIDAAAHCGDERIFVSAVEGSAITGDSHWELFPWDYESYRELPNIGVLSIAFEYSASAMRVQAGVIPPMILGVLRVPYFGLPGSTRSGEKARKKDSPTVRPRPLSRGRMSSSVVPG